MTNYLYQQSTNDLSQPIKTALDALTPDTRQSLLAILLAQQQQQQQQQPTTTYYQQQQQQNNYQQQQPLSTQITPVLSPSTYSNSTTTTISANPQLEFFSPLTSPALRPLANYHDHQFQAVIDQSTAQYMGTDTQQSDLNQSFLINHPDLGLCNGISSHQSSPILHPHQNYHHNHHSSASSINSMPVPNTPSTSTTSNTKLSGRQRPSRSTTKSRPSPLIRPIDKTTETIDSSAAKRARSLTGASISMSPSFQSGLAKMGLADSPSPIDLQSRELNSLSSSSIIDNPPSTATTDTLNHSIVLPNMPPPPPPPQSLSSNNHHNPNGWRIQPMTPASLFNFENSMVVEPLPPPASSSIGDPNDNLILRGLDSSGSGQYHESYENIQKTGHQSVIDHHDSSSSSSSGFPHPLIPSDQSMHVDQQLDTGSSKSASKENGTIKNRSYNTTIATGKNKSKDHLTTTTTTNKGKKNGNNNNHQKVRLDPSIKMTMMINEHDRGGGGGGGDEEEGEGEGEEDGNEGPEYRKSSHKVAEQRRRDSLKMCFEDLRQILPPIQWYSEQYNLKGEEEEVGDPTSTDNRMIRAGSIKRAGEGNVGGQRSINSFDPKNPNKGISKVALLRRSNHYILDLKKKLETRNSVIDLFSKILFDQQQLSSSSSSDQSIATTTTSSSSSELDRLSTTTSTSTSIRDTQQNQNQNQKRTGCLDPVQVLENYRNVIENPGSAQFKNQHLINDLKKVLKDIQDENRRDLGRSSLDPSSLNPHLNVNSNSNPNSNLKSNSNSNSNSNSKSKSKSKSTKNLDHSDNPSLPS
ncbi:hypothetical protein PSTG_15998 [Puccinia striiformis f. sp. tritici PST-78]|uniref:BHLH domain-containing protein n=1 Tax=Puccinia striiformis f. sp. tritici PST-78 TaxID=1165861 RepID=A0A0L0UUZ4_9BASI|nr:hypothetical protein PSTG_15984 [Puccinia striiformis f. sp. tritici PST-78]KNE90579.1 hypothetical protein PSTG_15998 [Puccinia striiformis f. sp. tritici PST-78]